MRNLSIANLILMILAILFGITLSSCNGERGNGKIKTDRRSLEGFEKIEISSDFSLNHSLFSRKEGNLQIRLIQSDKYEVSVETDENIFDYVKTKVDDNVLKIKIEDNPNPTKNINIFVYFKDLKELECAGLVTVESKDTLNLKSLKADLAGAVTVNLIIKTGELQLDMSGAGEAQLSGIAEKLIIDGSGSIDVDAFLLESDDVKIEISGAGDAKVFAKKSLKVDISGAGDVSYKGNPATVSKDVSGAGSIDKVE